MTIQDLIVLYEKKKKIHGDEAYRYISELLAEAMEIHRRDFKGNSHGQSWRAFKGKNLEKLIEYIICDEVRAMNLEIINGNVLEKTHTKNLSKALGRVKRNVLVDFGEYGSHLPDVDLIIYDPKSFDIIALISSKVTLRERIAQTGYWKLKLLNDKITQHIRVYFVTLDEDGTLTRRSPANKGRAISETDIDGSYVMSKTDIEVSSKVKMFSEFIGDLASLTQSSKNL